MGEGEFVMLGGRGKWVSMVLYKTREQFAGAIIMDGEEIWDCALRTIYGVNVYSGNRVSICKFKMEPNS